MGNSLGPKIAGTGTTWRDSFVYRPDHHVLVVSPNSSLNIELKTQDRLVLNDREGGQPIMIIAEDDDLKTTSLEYDNSAVKTSITQPILEVMAPALMPKHISKIKSMTAPQIMQSTAREFELSALKTLSLIILSAAQPNSDLPPGPIDVYLYHRSSMENSHFPLPGPLADLKDDFTVSAACGRAYTIKAGDYIQLIDSQGRQCTDFLAFSQRALDDGRERFIDGTATRSMLGTAYPQPGIASKFFDQDLNPLIEIVQDTCGRHDTFGHACTARTYHLAGYPDHDNCSDNISAEMKPYGVDRRASWPAVNYFFNTMIGADNTLMSDDGWSRPGDYVLMRALTDLVCVSTSCADDLSPINGWNPTDIQVRIYDKSHDFDHKTSFRTSVKSLPIMTQNSPLHPATSKLTRHFTVAKDMWIPQKFNSQGPTEEFWATREAASIQDLSQLRKYDIAGPDSQSFLNYLFPRDVTRLDIGKCAYTVMLNHHGGVMDDGILFRLNQNLFRWTGGNEKDGDWMRGVAEKHSYKVVIRETSHLFGNFAVQGPKTIDILKPLFTTPDSWPTLEELKPFSFTHAQLKDDIGITATLSATGYTGMGGIEVFAKPEHAAILWEKIMVEGQSHGLIPMGLDGLELCRIEAGLPAAGSEFDEHQTPFIAGLGFTISKKKHTPYIGKDAVMRDLENPRHQTVPIHVDGTWLPQAGAPIYQDESVIGHVTSSCISPLKGHPHGLARIVTTVTSSEASIGQLDHHIKRLDATLVLT